MVADNKECLADSQSLIVEQYLQVISVCRQSIVFAAE